MIDNDGVKQISHTDSHRVTNCVNEHTKYLKESAAGSLTSGVRSKMNAALSQMGEQKLDTVYLDTFRKDSYGNNYGKSGQSEGRGTAQAQDAGEATSAAAQVLQKEAAAAQTQTDRTAEGGVPVNSSLHPATENRRDGSIFVMPAREKRQTFDNVWQEFSQKAIRKISALSVIQKLRDFRGRFTDAKDNHKTDTKGNHKTDNSGLNGKLPARAVSQTAASMKVKKEESLPGPRPTLEQMSNSDSYLLDSYDRTGGYSRLGADDNRKPR